MKLTQEQLKQIIREELQSVMEGGPDQETKQWITDQMATGIGYGLGKRDLDNQDPRDQNFQLILSDIYDAFKSGHLKWWSNLHSTDAQRLGNMVSPDAIRQLGTGGLKQLVPYLNLLLRDMDSAMRGDLQERKKKRNTARRPRK